VTRTIRSIPTEIALGAEGLDVECAASFDTLGPQRVAMLTRRIGRLDDARVRICDAVAALADC
jgi:mRNA-degrading endonuclease toxin of MazEF toxin-antitoxin module